MVSRGPGSFLKLRAPAKVNLSLRILERRSDGYHNLDTVMQKLELSDLLTLAVTDASGIVLRCPDSELPEDRSNLVWRAAETFLTACGCEKLGIALTLEKNIPIAAGLGGGSSDAGAVLVGLNRLLGTGLTTAELIALARPLGADVPFFVTDFGAVRAEGVGDQMVAVPSLKNCTIVLVNPGISVSTRWVYEKYALTIADKDSKIYDFQKKMDHVSPYAARNDLEWVTLATYPELEILKQDLIALGAASVLMSGSGPTVFGVFPDENNGSSTLVRLAVKALQQQNGVKVFVTQPV
ncbi:MAG: 4-(cytidine 5'-diphospho)-2-C-methyl-D-erythritol kinase [Desulfoarculaceae bacterium]|nr:4-(cytidine 5'-diphospho)-2-C-methyl-D-erythritol kinase [Desulfoarculaceae bacterium]